MYEQFARRCAEASCRKLILFLLQRYESAKAIYINNGWPENFDLAGFQSAMRDWMGDDYPEEEDDEEDEEDDGEE